MNETSTGSPRGGIRRWLVVSGLAAAALGLAACDGVSDRTAAGGGGGGNGGEGNGGGGGGGNGALQSDVIQASNGVIGLTAIPKDAEIDPVDDVGTGLIMESLSAKFSGFAVETSPQTEAAPASLAVEKSSTKSSEDELARLIQAIRDALGSNGDNILERLDVAFQNTGRAVDGTPTALAQLSLDLLAGETATVSEIRSRLLEILTGSEQGAASGTPQGVTDEARNFTFTLGTTLGVDDLLLVLGIAPDEAFNNLPADLNDFANGRTLARSDLSFVEDEETFQTEATAAADLLWVIDDSGSMSQEQDNIAAGIGEFFDILDASGLDYHLGATTTGNDCGELSQISTGDRFITSNTANARGEWSGDQETGIDGIARPGTSGSGTETGIFCGEQALLVDPTGTQPNFNREGAPDVLIFVSDEPDNETVQGRTPRSAPAGYQVRELGAYETIFTDAGTTIFSIVGTATVLPGQNDPDPDFNCSGEGGDADGGAAYGRLSSITNGGRTSICADANDWSPLFQEVALAASGGASQYELSNIPVIPSVRVFVEGNEVSRDPARRNGFDVFLSATRSAIIFYGDALPEPGNEVRVVYDRVDSES